MEKLIIVPFHIIRKPDANHILDVDHGISVQTQFYYFIHSLDNIDLTRLKENNLIVECDLASIQQLNCKQRIFDVHNQSPS